MSWTLAEIRERGYEIAAHCQNGADCTHFSKLDMAALIGRLGGDFDIIERRSELLAHLVCSRCGRKGMTIQITPMNVPTAEGGHSMSPW